MKFNPKVRCQLRMPNLAHLLDQVRENAEYRLPTLQHDSRRGQSVNIYGAGPTLRHAEIDNRPDEAWACNGALPYLKEQRPDVRVTHGFAIDQGIEMLKDQEFGKTYDVGYYLASSVHPSLIAHLLEEKRKVSLFHNYLGVPGKEDEEQALYTTRGLYPDSVRVGHGLNSVPRAVCLALALGFSEIRVYGADCAGEADAPKMPAFATPEYERWMDALVMYADGRTAGECYRYSESLAEVTIDGTRYHTRPDMIISAKHLLDLESAYRPRVKLMGDTHVTAIRKVTDNDPSWWEDFPVLEPTGEVSGFGMAGFNGELELRIA